MSDQETNVKIGADTAGLNTGMHQAEGTVEQAANSIHASMQKMSTQVGGAVGAMQAKIEGSFGMIGAAIHKINGAFMAATAVLAGGAAFKEVIKETVAFNSEIMKLSTSMGITKEEASGLVVALDHIGVSTESFNSATKMMTRSLAGNEKAFNDLHIETRQANGQYRSMTDIMLDANKALSALAEGTDREIAGKKIYGRSWDEVRKIIKLTSDEMKHGEERAKELGLVVSEDGAKQTANYKLQMRELHLTMTAFAKVIGDAVLPILAKLGEWFNDIGPTAVKVIRVAFNTLVGTIDTVVSMFFLLWDVAKGVVRSLAMAIGELAIAFAKLMTGDFAGAAAEFKNIGASIGEVWKDTLEEMETDTKNYAARLAGLMGNGPKSTEKKKGGGHITGEEGKDKKEKEDKSRLPEWENELEKMKIAEGDFFKDSRASDLEHWESKLTLTKDKSAERFGIEKKIYDLKKQQAIEGLNIELQEIKMVSEESMKGSQDRIDAAEFAAQKIKAAYGAESKEYGAAQREIAKMQREQTDDRIKREDMVVEKQKQINLLKLDMERENNAYAKEMMQITAEEEIKAEIGLENRKHDIEQAALQNKLNIQRKGSIEYSQILQQMEVAEQGHANKISQINHKLAIEQKKEWSSIFDSIAHSFSSAIQGMITGGMKLQQAMKQIATAILNKFIDMGVLMLFDWVKKQILMTTATTTQDAVRAASNTATATEAMATTQATSVVAAASYAAVAAVAAMASVAAIPFIGWAMSPGVGASTYAEGMTFAAMASAEQGYDIPKGVNPVVQAHSNEMVLPSEQADVIRNLAANPQSNKGGGDTHFHITAMDAKSFEHFAKRNGPSLASSMQNQSRNFRSPK